MYNEVMRFQIDPDKGVGNLKKHGVSLADAEGGSLPTRSLFTVQIRTPRMKSGLLRWAWERRGGYGGGLYMTRR